MQTAGISPLDCAAEVSLPDRASVVKRIKSLNSETNFLRRLLRLMESRDIKPEGERRER